MISKTTSSMIDNWTEITGEIVSVMHEPAAENYERVRVRVDETKSYMDFPNLVQLPPSTNEIVVKLETSMVEKLHIAPGHKINALVHTEGQGRYRFADGSIKIF